jgi:hypothetical protein
MQVDVIRTTPAPARSADDPRTPMSRETVA